MVEKLKNGQVSELTGIAPGTSKYYSFDLTNDAHTVAVKLVRRSASDTYPKIFITSKNIHPLQKAIAQGQASTGNPSTFIARVDEKDTHTGEWFIRVLNDPSSAGCIFLPKIFFF